MSIYRQGSGLPRGPETHRHFSFHRRSGLGSDKGRGEEGRGTTFTMGKRRTKGGEVGGFRGRRVCVGSLTTGLDDEEKKRVQTGSYTRPRTGTSTE